MYNISLVGVLALKRTNVVSTFQTLHSARLQEKRDTCNFVFHFIRTLWKMHGLKKSVKLTFEPLFNIGHTIFCTVITKTRTFFKFLY